MVLGAAVLSYINMQKKNKKSNKQGAKVNTTVHFENHNGLIEIPKIKYVDPNEYMNKDPIDKPVYILPEQIQH